MENFREVFKFNPSAALSDYFTSYPDRINSKKEIKKQLELRIEELRHLQSMLYAHDKYGVLIILQAMDAAGKDGIIKHVMKGVNPQGCQVKSFKAPSTEELDHDFMWRCMKALPERGNIGIFNRSYYEEVLIVRVHPKILEKQKLPAYHPQLHEDENFWKTRFQDISNIEKYLSNNGFLVLKLFLNVSFEEQKNRFLERINDPEKNWKFTSADINERQYWEQYHQAYEEMLKHTSSPHAPWYVIPADEKWYSRLAVCNIILSHLKDLDLSFPQLAPQELAQLDEARKILES